MKYYIAVSGNLGSGKSTLARIVAENFGFRYIPQRKTEFDLLAKFFKRPSRWFLDTQLTFLINKATEIQEALDKNYNIVVDRSIHEDINVFAKYWTSKYKIDIKATSLYKLSALYITSRLPKPDLIFFCEAGRALCEERIKNRRDRQYQTLYPKKHILELHNLYEDWLKQIKDIPIVKIDTEQNSLLRKGTVRTLLSEIQYLLSSGFENTTQLSLFENSANTNSNTNFDFSILNVPESLESIKHVASLKLSHQKHKRTVYIAAPFTSFATQSVDESELFSPDTYGKIEPEYKNNLLEIDKFFRGLGYNTLLPHRDINDWGQKRLSPREVLDSVKKFVNLSDIVFAIPSNSLGVHLELGFAIASQKKIIIAQVEALQNSFFVRAFAGYEDVYFVEATDLKSLPAQFKKSGVRTFMQNLMEVSL